MKFILKSNEGFLSYEAIVSLFIVCCCIIPLLLNLTAIKVKSREADNYFISQNLLYDYKFKIYDNVELESNYLVEINGITYNIVIDNEKICVNYVDSKERRYCEEYQ